MFELSTLFSLFAIIIFFLKKQSWLTPFVNLHIHFENVSISQSYRQSSLPDHPILFTSQRTYPVKMFPLRHLPPNWARQLIPSNTHFFACSWQTHSCSNQHSTHKWKRGRQILSYGCNLNWQKLKNWIDSIYLMVNGISVLIDICFINEFQYDLLKPFRCYRLDSIWYI